MNLIDYINELEVKYGWVIQNKSTEDTVYFHCGYNQPFDFRIEVYYSEIFNKEEFRINFPSLNLKKHEIAKFAETSKLVTDITMKLNELLEKYKAEFKNKAN